MITLPNPLPTDAPALATLWQSALADIKTTQNADMLDSYNRAKALYPTLVTALNRACAPKPDNFDPRAGLEWMPLLREDTNNLYGNATLAEKTYLLRDQGLTFDPANAEKAFSSLVDFNARNRGLDRAAAESDVRNRFSALAALRDGIVTARTIGTALPAVGNPGAAVWSALTGKHTVPSNTMAGSGPPNNPFIPGATPLARALKAGALANDMDKAGVRATYADAMRKHFVEHPGDGPLVAHRKVLAAHPDLARALNDAGAGGDDDATGVTATANERTGLALANSGDYTQEDRDIAREALAVARENSRTYGAPLSAMVETRYGFRYAEDILAAV